jgi:hypothetical protein
MMMGVGTVNSWSGLDEPLRSICVDLRNLGST